METVDWVKERAACSTGIMFERLKVEVESDVAARNELRGDYREFVFQFIKANGDMFTVALDGLVRPRRLVQFILRKHSIEVQDGEGKIFLRGTPTLCDDRVCRLRVEPIEKEKGNDKPKECESWQFRKMALEQLFFAHV